MNVQTIFSFIAGLLIPCAIFWYKWGQFSKIKEKLIEQGWSERESALQTIREKGEFLEKKYRDKVLELEKQKIRHFEKEKANKDKQAKLYSLQKKIDKKTFELDTREKTLEQQAHQLAGWTQERAKTFLERKLLHAVLKEGEAKVKRMEEEASYQGKKILINSMGRLAFSQVSWWTTSSVPIQEEMKRRVVGKEGRNIRYFEKLTGTTLLIDEAPGMVAISSFDPIRKEIAKKTLQNLLEGRAIYPSMIEEVYTVAQQQIEDFIGKKGEESATSLELFDLHKELILLLGKLHFRYSLGQNVLDHSIEVAHLMHLMALELGLNGRLAKRIGLLHDIGKALDHLTPYPHAIAGQKIAAKYGETDEVAEGIGAHHCEIPCCTLEAALCPVANALSAERPGARVDKIGKTVKRVQQIEDLAHEFEEIKTLYALKGGREVHVLFAQEKLKSEEVPLLVEKLKLRIKKEIALPEGVHIIATYEKRVKV